MEYRILGPLEVLHDGQPLTLGGAKQRALLAVLLLHANQVVSVDRLIDDLWGEEPPDSAQNVVQTYVSRLRKALEPGAGSSVLVSRKPGYVLQIAPGELDLDKFERLVQEAREARERGADDSATHKLRDALALWRGDPLADFAFEPFAQRDIERLRDSRAGALEDRIQAELNLGRGDDLVGELQALVAEHPLRERLRAHLMVALYRAGRQAEALAAYQEARRTLVDELGIDPGPGLQQLETAILAQDPSLLRTAAVPASRPASTPVTVPPTDRSILVSPRDPDRIQALLSLAEPLACTQPPHELIMSRLLGPWETEFTAVEQLPAVISDLNARRSELLNRGVASGVVAFTSEDPAHDLARLVSDHPVELAIVDGAAEMFGPHWDALVPVLERLECDVAVLLGDWAPRFEEGRPILAPFGGAEHDWAALHLAAWLAGAHGVPLRLLGVTADPTTGKRDASRLLASASMIVQRVTGIAAEPVLVEPGAGVLAEAQAAGLIVTGLSDRWREEGLGEVRSQIAGAAEVPTLVLRRGWRSGAPPDPEASRYTWSRIR